MYGSEKISFIFAIQHSPQIREATFSLQKARPYKRGTTAWVKVFFRTNTENVLLLNVGHTKSPVRIEK
jgi:hypothetical protein